MAVLRDNEYVAGTLTKLIGQFGEHTAGIAVVIFALLKEHGEKLIALAGFVFGVWRWWKYREHILHKRLEEYLKESDKRLRNGQDDVLAALYRPGPSRAFLDPLFIPSELRSVLRERDWDKRSIAATVERSADIQLSKAVKKIERRLVTARENMQSLHQQLATAHVLKGAIASASASRVLSDSMQSNASALTSFKTALQVPEQERNIAAKEYESHQLRKLGHFNEALDAYEDMAEFAESIDDQRKKALTIARAKRYRAEIFQAQASEIQQDGSRLFFETTLAYNLLSYTIGDSALKIRHRFAPFQDWDLIEQADIHYVTAFVSKNLDRTKIASENLDQSGTCYESVITGLPRNRLWTPRRVRRLRAAAAAGKKRVNDAQQGTYDVKWLFPKSDVP